MHINHCVKEKGKKKKKKKIVSLVLRKQGRVSKLSGPALSAYALEKFACESGEQLF